MYEVYILFLKTECPRWCEHFIMNRFNIMVLVEVKSQSFVTTRNICTTLQYGWSAWCSWSLMGAYQTDMMRIWIALPNYCFNFILLILFQSSKLFTIIFSFFLMCFLYWNSSKKIYLGAWEKDASWYKLRTKNSNYSVYKTANTLLNVCQTILIRQKNFHCKR